MATRCLKDSCIYSTYSLQFYLLFPLVKVGQFIGLPPLLGYIVALTGPIILLELLAITRPHQANSVEHYPKPIYHRSSSMTIGVVVISAILGLLCQIGISFVAERSQPHLIPLGIYLILLSFFHFSEYFVTSLTNPNTLNLSSFLIDQSIAYVLAISFSFVEYVTEVYAFPQFKKFNLIALVGLLLTISGEIMRKLAMFTAGRNFSHTISTRKCAEHKLVTHGIYGLLRHPSYTGWFYWALGTQILLQNPLCFVMFAVISHQFFKDRIVYEEAMLIEFFGSEYQEYRGRVGIWMPI